MMSIIQFNGGVGTLQLVNGISGPVGRRFESRMRPTYLTIFAPYPLLAMVHNLTATSPARYDDGGINMFKNFY
jgi:hypothetical protein